MKSLEFIDMIDKVSIHAVDFKTGEITIEWHPAGMQKVMSKLNITQDELKLIRKGKSIEAIKAVRNRTNQPLSSAKEIVDSARDELSGGNPDEIYHICDHYGHAAHHIWCSACVEPLRCQ